MSNELVSALQIIFNKTAEVLVRRNKLLVLHQLGNERTKLSVPSDEGISSDLFVAYSMGCSASTKVSAHEIKRTENSNTT